MNTNLIDALLRQIVDAARRAHDQVQAADDGDEAAQHYIRTQIARCVRKGLQALYGDDVTLDGLIADVQHAGEIDDASPKRVGPN